MSPLNDIDIKGKTFQMTPSIDIGIYGWTFTITLSIAMLFCVFNEERKIKFIYIIFIKI